MRFLFLMFFVMSCSQLGQFTVVQEDKSLLDNYERLNSEDYEEHLISLKDDFLKNIKLIRLSSSLSKYLENIYNGILSKNELLINESYKPKFYIVDSAQTFYFSLPRANFFISSNLLLKYFKNEDVFAAFLTREMVQSLKLVYEKKYLVPIGKIGLNKIITLLRIPIAVINNLNRWSYYAFNRSGYNSSAYLQWLQLQNKNSIDFTLQNGDNRVSLKEEYLFKKFLITQKIAKIDMDIIESNSSKGFYKLIRFIKRRSRAFNRSYLKTNRIDL